MTQWKGDLKNVYKSKVKKTLREHNMKAFQVCKMECK